MMLPDDEEDGGAWSLAALFLMAIGISVLTALGLSGCRIPNFGPGEYPRRSIPACTQQVDTMEQCRGRRLIDGVVDCYKCFRGDAAIPGPIDQVAGCFDTRNHYCVDQYGCDDVRCEPTMFSSVPDGIVR